MKFHPYSILFCAFLGFLSPSCKTTLGISKTEGSNQLVQSTSNQPTQLDTLIKPFKDSLDKSMNEVIGHCTEYMSVGIPQGLLGNWVADLSLVCAKRKGIYADFSLFNHGGLRTVLQSGDLSRRNVFQLMPFENELVVVELSYDSIVSLLGYLGQHNDTTINPVAKKGVCVSKELRLNIKQGMAHEVSIVGQAMTNKTYKVVTSDYLAKGGDQMCFFLNPVAKVNVNIKMRDAILEAIHLNPVVKGRLDKRISY